MRNSKLYSILEHFDKYEQNRCRKFLQSPYFNRDETLVAIFDLLTAEINSEKNKCIEKEDIWEQLNIEGEYDDVRFRKYLSDLTKLMEDFLCLQIYEKNPLQKANHLISAVAERKIEKLYNSSVRMARRISENFPYKSANFYYENYAVENSYYSLVDFETRRDAKSNHEEISTNLDYFYIAEKLRILCSILSRHNVVSHEYNILIKDEIVDFVKKNLKRFKDIPAVAVYFQVYQALIDPTDESHYFLLKELLDKYALSFPLEEATEIYTYAQNYCVRKINKGNSKFIEELFELYKMLLEQRIIIVDEILSPWYFRNITTVALRLGEYEWTEKFVTDYQHYLPDGFRQSAVSYNLAQVYFYQKKYNEVKTLLQEVEFEDFTYNLNSKAMLIATYYETDEIEPLYSLFESFRTYLNRHKDIPVARRQSFSDLIKFTRKLTRIMPGEKAIIEKLKKELETNKNVASHGWLMEKVTEME